MAEFLEWVFPSSMPIITGVGLLLTYQALRLNYKALKANHDWNRRKAAVEIVARWNDETSVHRKAIEEIRPGLVDLDKSERNRTPEITKADALAIYTATPGSEDWKLRFHFIELLNFFESICVAYHHGVADKEILIISLHSPLGRWHAILVNFIDVVGTQRGYKPWEPFELVVAQWIASSSPPRNLTA